MSYMDPAWRAERISWRFRRSGEDGEATRVFDAFPPEVQAQLVELAHVKEGEVPAVATFQSGTEWVLVTSERVIWPESGALASVSLAEVKDATLDPRELLAAGSKSQVGEITVVIRDGRQVRVRAEAGRPLSGMWNALKMVASWNRDTTRQAK